MLGEELAVAHMDTTLFFEDCAYLPDWPGVPFGDEEGEIVHISRRTTRIRTRSNDAVPRLVPRSTISPVADEVSW